jgi:hypothetical protein
MAGQEVTECTGGARAINDEALADRRLRHGVELGLAIVERRLERQAHLQLRVVLLGPAARGLQLLGDVAAPEQKIGPRLRRVA